MASQRDRVAIAWLRFFDGKLLGGGEESPEDDLKAVPC
jgi:hypothetical protein